MAKKTTTATIAQTGIPTIATTPAPAPKAAPKAAMPTPAIGVKLPRSAKGKLARLEWYRGVIAANTPRRTKKARATIARMTAYAAQVESLLAQ
jgi:hypothetical protein